MRSIALNLSISGILGIWMMNCTKKVVKTIVLKLERKHTYTHDNLFIIINNVYLCDYVYVLNMDPNNQLHIARYRIT